jgi:hypothetical protein
VHREKISQTLLVARGSTISYHVKYNCVHASHPYLVNGGVSIQQYADNTNVLMQHDLEKGPKH